MVGAPHGVDANRRGAAAKAEPGRLDRGGACGFLVLLGDGVFQVEDDQVGRQLPRLGDGAGVKPQFSGPGLASRSVHG
jgi:hypothetical protein